MSIPRSKHDCAYYESHIGDLLNNIKTEFFYFVADGSGGHIFAKTLNEHNKNVIKWRKIERELKSN